MQIKKNKNLNSPFYKKKSNSYNIGTKKNYCVQETMN